MVKKILRWCRDKIMGACRWYAHLYKGRPWYVKFIVGLISFFLAFIIYLGMVDINFLGLFGKSPGYKTGISDPQTSQASEIYSADGKLIGKYFNENRTPVEYDDVNPQFWKALIDTEDERFYSHYGIDPISLLGAVKDAILHNDARGASTITQQLSKNLFRMRTQYSTGLLGNIPGLRMLIMKTKEWIVATKLETLFDKNEILTMYANTVDFGSNSFGIKTACKTYFNTTPAKLTVDQAAILVGMLKATTYYNPISHPENCLQRRNVVLYNMVTHGDLTKEAFDSLSQKPIQLDYKVETNYDGQATYFREAVADNLKDWCRDNGYDLYSSGLKIYTTIDTRLQKYAEDAARSQMQQLQQNFKSHWGSMDPWRDEHGKLIPDFIENIAKRTEHYKYLSSQFPDDPDSIDYYLNLPHTVKVFDYENGEVEKELSTMDSIRYMVSFMHCAFVAMEAQTGDVKAWVGDIDFNTWKYDKVTALRQPGSTFKLFVYTEAMNQGLTPCDKRRDEPISLKAYDPAKKKEVTWRPHNANGYFTWDSLTLKRAFAQSINSVAVRLGQEMGIKRIAETAHKMGITNHLEEAPSMALGSSDVCLLEMVNAYSVIADNGKHHKPKLVTKVVDKDGKVVYSGATTTEQVIPYKSAFFMQVLLQGGLKERGGTSVALNGYMGNHPDCEWGGKTGTSNNHSDAWFMGVSPKLVVGAWVGGEYRSIHFRTGALGQGSRTALPICGKFLHSVLADPAFKHYHAKFDPPKDPDITKDMYEQCVTYYTPRYYNYRPSNNRLIADEEIVLDENGNPVAPPKQESNDNGSDEPSIYYDDY